MGRRRRRSRAGVHSHVHLHGRDPGTIGVREGHAERHGGDAEAVSGCARRCGDGDGDDPRCTDRRGRRGRDHSVRYRAAADAGSGL